MRYSVAIRILALVALSLPPAPASGATKGDRLPRVRDPDIISANGHYYVFSTGRGIPVLQSDDLFNWRSGGRVFEKFDLPPWSARDIPRATNIWAPDVHLVNGQYRLYYSVSSIRSRRSAIGLAVNAALDPTRHDYLWQDRGRVIETTDADDYNAIDPNLVIDAQRRQWLVFGSYWSGIKARRIDPETGMLSKEDSRLYGLAARPLKDGHFGSIEAPYVVRRDGFYYLFVSFGMSGGRDASTYNVRIGRSRSATGPYVDRAGQDMRQGGGTLILCSYDGWRGPGHNGILQSAGGDFLVNHAYDVKQKYRSVLQIRPLMWQTDGWPLVGEPLAGPVSRASTQPAANFDPHGKWMHQVGIEKPKEITFDGDGKIHGLNAGETWRFEDGVLMLGGDSRTAERCIIDPAGDGFVGRSQAGALVRAWRLPVR